MEKDIEGLVFEIEGDILSNKKLEEVWKTLTNKPLPKVSAIVLENGEFFRVLGILQTSRLVVDRSEWEWGREGLNYPIDAFIFRGEEGLFIRIRKEGVLSIEENLRH